MVDEGGHKQCEQNALAVTDMAATLEDGVRAQKEH